MGSYCQRSKIIGAKLASGWACVGILWDPCLQGVLTRQQKSITILGRPRADTLRKWDFLKGAKIWEL